MHIEVIKRLSSNGKRKGRLAALLQTKQPLTGYWVPLQTVITYPGEPVCQMMARRYYLEATDVRTLLNIEWPDYNATGPNDAYLLEDWQDTGRGHTLYKLYGYMVIRTEDYQRMVDVTTKEALFLTREDVLVT